MESPRLSIEISIPRADAKATTAELLPVPVGRKAGSRVDMGCRDQYTNRADQGTRGHRPTSLPSLLAEGRRFKRTWQTLHLLVPASVTGSSNSQSGFILWQGTFSCIFDELPSKPRLREKIVMLNVSRTLIGCEAASFILGRSRCKQTSRRR